MARILIVGCGCRGLALARELRRDGHAVRGTTRDPGRAPELERAGVEPWVGDPDRVGSLVYALENVTAYVWLLGSADGAPEDRAALHGPRLSMMLEKTVDTTVRGVAYEAAGSVETEVLEGGVRIVREAERTWEIPVTVLRAEPTPYEAWLDATLEALHELLASPRVPPTVTGPARDQGTN